MTTCINGNCEYKPKLARQPNKRTQDEIRYGQLWAEIELPKLIGDGNTNAIHQRTTKTISP